MAFFQLLISDFENRLKRFDHSALAKRIHHGFFYKVILFPVAFFTFLLLSIFCVLKSHWAKKKGVLNPVEHEETVIGSDQNSLPIVKHLTVKRAADYTTKYLYQTDFGTLDPEEKEERFKEELEQSRKEYYEDLWNRELTAGGEGIFGCVLAEVSNIPVGDPPSPSKAKSTSEEPDSKAADIESLREKLLTPKEPSGDGDRVIRFEPITSE